MSTTSSAERRGRPSLGDVAASAGVSKAAVSKVIRNAYGVSPAMRERVETAIQDLGYRPRIAARSMRGASFTIGIEIPQLGNDFFTQVMQGAATQLDRSGYQLIIAPALGEVKGAAVLDALLDRQVDGLIAVSPEVTPQSLEELGREVPLVLLGRHDPSNHYDTLVNDDDLGARLMMGHLIGLGHREIAHLTVRPSPEVPVALLPHTIRRRAYETVMGEHSLVPQVVEGGPLEHDAYRAARELLRGSRRPTALFAANDTLAVGALRARIDLGLRAQDVAIGGYDDIDLASHPLVSLTTIDQSGRVSGARAIQLLMERIAGGREEATHFVVPPELRVRSSTAPLSSSDSSEQSADDEPTGVSSAPPPTSDRQAAERLGGR